MKYAFAAIAMAIALPATAHAQGAPETEKGCCAKMRAEGKTCCCCDKAKDGHAEAEAKGADHTAH